jgi:hypothetical protein
MGLYGFGPVGVLEWQPMLTDKDVSTYDPQAYGPTPFSPRDSQGSCQSAEQGDYKRLIYFYSLTTPTLSNVELENDYSLHPKKNDVLRFKICPKKNDILLNLACVHVHVGMQQSIST